MAAGLLLAALPAAAMQEIGDEELAQVTGQALFLADKIIGPGAPGGGAQDYTTTNDFTFYRLALDADLALSMNINKMQLGCGGFNEGLVANSCDLDIDFLRLSGGTPLSDFVMARPYIEIAIKNDQDKTRREVVGIKIGAESASGRMGIGRTYATGQVNQENGGTCGNTTSSVDTGVRLACNSGGNTLSGYMRAEMSGNGRVQTGLGNGDACFGYTRVNTGDTCTAGDAFFAALRGTRMQRILIHNANLELYNQTGLLGIANNGASDIKVNLRMLHDIALDPALTRDFFMSFQREQVSYPIFNQASPYNADGVSGTGGGASNTGIGNPNGTDVYSAVANTGWWMNITYAATLELNAGTLQLGLGDVFDALGEGADLVNINLGQVPTDTCFGSAVFC